MSFELESLTTDAVLETSGILVEYPGTGVKFLIASNSNPYFAKAIRDGFAKLSPKQHKDEAVTEPIILAATAKHILRGWEGPVTSGKETLDPNNESHRLLLLKSRPFKDWIGTISTDYRNYRVETEKAEDEELEKP